MWTYDWPDRPGYYWFYGYPHGPAYYDPQISFIRVFEGKNEQLYFVGGSQFMYEVEAQGVWMPAVVPAISELLDIEIKNDWQMEE
ncbi:hypothetical protein LCGC14_3013030 [marine sediment metagenome]|uniref:Uncharacterized protein n=1 Tax=marine sediment metagenome TaxID=412755 RepID=A0A0F8ZNS2_9ZZZZ|nr:hypothetical protein [bacterium]